MSGRMGLGRGGGVCEVAVGGWGCWLVGWSGRRGSVLEGVL